MYFIIILLLVLVVHDSEETCIYIEIYRRHKYEQSTVGMINFPRENGGESLEMGLKVCRISTDKFGSK